MTSLRAQLQRGEKKKGGKEMNKRNCVIPIALLLIMTIPFAMADTVTINVSTSGNADVNVQSNNGTFSVVYNGRDILGELEAARKSVNDIEKTLIYWGTLTQVNEVEQHVLVVEEQLNNLTRDLNSILNELYGNLAFTMHVVGINPGNSTVAIQLITGNMTVADYVEDILVDVDVILVDLNATEQDLASIQSQIYTIYDGMMMHDELIMNGRSSVRVLNITFNAEVRNLTERFDEALEGVWDADMELDDRIDVLNTYTEELRDEFRDELARELKKTRDSMNVISTMFVVFSIIAIGIVAKTRRP